MYAIAFDMDGTMLEANYPTASYNNAYKDIKSVLIKHGFNWQQGSVYFGDETVNAVTCVIAVQQVAQTYPWFAGSVKDIRMLRIEDNNDLLPAITAVP